MNNIVQIKLADIYPSPTNPRKHFDEKELKELSESIKKHGLIQPITVREQPDRTGKYECVCGERRLRASVIAKMTTVAVIVRVLTDEEVIELQFTENLQRTDVHPMDEAVTFKSMMENKVKPYSIADIAAKINKPETFVAHRLSLNNLIPELQKDFWSGKFLIGVAVLFSRLSPADQKEAAKQCKEWQSKDYKSINAIRGYINNSILRELSSVPFKKDDLTLNPKAGSCVTCLKRSGSNKLLFDDIKQDDRCFDPACFTIKMNAYLLTEISRVIVEEPNTMLLASGGTVPKFIIDLAKEHGVKIHSYMNEPINKSKYGNAVKTNCIWVNGSDAGKKDIVYVESKTASIKSNLSAAGNNSNAAIDEEIEGIKQRTKRAAELDEEKVYARILQAVSEHPTQNKILPVESGVGTVIPKAEWGAMLYLIFEHLGWNNDPVRKALGLPSDATDKRKDFAEALLKLNHRQITYLIRKAFWAKHSGNYPTQVAAVFMRMMAESYGDIPIETFEAEQKEKRDKREERAKQRIAALQAQKKVKAEPKAKKPAVKKAAKKK